MTKAAMNIFVKVFVWIRAFISLRQIPKSGFYGKYMLNFIRNCQTISQSSIIFLFLPEMCEASSCFTDLHSSGCTLVSHCGSNLYFHGD